MSKFFVIKIFWRMPASIPTLFSRESAFTRILESKQLLSEEPSHDDEKQKKDELDAKTLFGSLATKGHDGR